MTTITINKGEKIEIIFDSAEECFEISHDNDGIKIIQVAGWEVKIGEPDVVDGTLIYASEESQ